MEERKFVNLRKEEFNIKEFVKKTFGKGKISTVRIEYTPVGEKIVVSTHKPGLVIGKRGEKIEELTEVLKKKFKMENPHIDIAEITKPDFDAQLMADEIALSLERFGSMRFKAICYKMLQRIKQAGALGAEIRASGKLPGERAKSWRFAFGYLKKTGETSKIVDRAESVAQTLPGVIGIKVSILSPEKKIHDQITLTEEIFSKIRSNAAFVPEIKIVNKIKKARKIKKEVKK
jgi:small subunit ribosomal protein S3